MPIRPQPIDPLAVFLDRHICSRGRPIPLVATDFTVNLAGGLAVVETRRTFRNIEETSIEATMTFPVPVDATLFGMEAKIGERRLRAVAQRRNAAREAYEEALEDGRAAVLHEEVLRGVHMLSVGHVAPGAAIEVTTRWAALLSIVDGGGRLRIPLTAGDIYGRSSLADSDDLVHAPVRLDGTIAIHGAGARLNGRPASQERTAIAMDRPLDIAVPLWAVGPLAGRAADGASIALTVVPEPAADGRISAAVLVDRSGSMNERAGDRGETKHEVAVRALNAVADDLRKGDVVALFSFDNGCEEIGRTDTEGSGVLGFGARSVPARFRRLVSKLGSPRGGTEIGSAIETVLGLCPGADIILITDGKSHALDVQTLARAGQRVTAVLVGEDSLEANVGHLAALTGGDILAAATDDLPAAVRAAVAGLRAPSLRTRSASGGRTTITVRRGNARIEAVIDRGVATQTAGDVMAPGVAAIVAAMELPTLPEEEAAALAEAEGLVTHLTSLLVVDDVTDARLGVPSTRKIPLPSPAASASIQAASMISAPRDFTWTLAKRQARAREDFPKGLAEEVSNLFGFGGVGEAIDWAGLAAQLSTGDISGLPLVQAEEIESLARDSRLVDFARRHGIDPVVAAIGLLAHAQSGDRAAARVGRAILGAVDAKEIADLLAELGIADERKAG